MIADRPHEASSALARLIWSTASDLPREAQASVVTVGTFDGVHRGHRRLISRTCHEARRLGAQAVAVTWDRHPKSIVSGAGAPPLVTSIERKIELLRESGLDLVVVLRLDESLARWAPERFVFRFFAAALQTRMVVVGSDWRFGHRAAGDVALLAQLGGIYGFDVQVVPRSGETAEPASSTLIRSALAAGDLQAAGDLLGRIPELEASCEPLTAHGAQVGVVPGLACPPPGVYRARIQGAGATLECEFRIESDRRILLTEPGVAHRIEGERFIRLQLTGGVSGHPCHRRPAESDE